MKCPTVVGVLTATLLLSGCMPISNLSFHPAKDPDASVATIITQIETRNSSPETAPPTEPENDWSFIVTCIKATAVVGLVILGLVAYGLYSIGQSRGQVAGLQGPLDAFINAPAFASCVAPTPTSVNCKANA